MGKQTFTAGQVLTAAEMNSLQENDYNWAVSTKTASYTLAAGDEGTRIVMDSATATTITVDDAIFSAGDVVWVHNVGAGTCTITAGTATVNTAASLDLAQWEGGSLYFTSASSAIFFRGPAAGVATLEASGGTEVTSGGYKYHTFTSSGTLTVSQAGVCEVLVVGGGGAGACHGTGGLGAGGGGAGGLASPTNLYLTATSHTITIGAGGTGGTYSGSPGTATSIGSILWAFGGGAGGASDNEREIGGYGGSGGGGGEGQYGGSGVSGQGNDGGDGTGGGGGGAGAAGSNSVSADVAGAGGDGLAFSTWATATSTGDGGYYAGGGGGAARITAGAGGAGGGADGKQTSGPANDGDANTGGGGGGLEATGGTGGNGGSGIVIVRYAV